MSLRDARRSRIAEGIYSLLNPVPFGCFVAALIFDLTYLQNAVVFWNKAAAWLIVFGLLFAVVPRLINLTRVWITSRRTASRADRFDFWMNLCAIVVATVNAFVHSRDAYGVMPTGAWLSVFTVLFLAVGLIASAVDRTAAGSYINE
jgi:uncharacterized membrane protein